MFLTPKTHILKNKGVLIGRNGWLPIYFQINEEWYKILPIPTETKRPITLHPTLKGI